MQLVRLERPNGKQPGWQHPIPENAVFCVFLCLFLVGLPLLSLSNYIKPQANHALGLMLVVLSFLILYSFMTYFSAYHYQKRKRIFAENLAMLGSGIIRCTPTLSGWIACGTDWVGSSGFPMEIQRITASNIENFSWGNTKGKYFVHHPDSSFGPPDVLIKKPIKRFWIFVPSKNEPSNSIIVFFRREREMLEWKAILDSIIAKKPLSISSPNPLPTSGQLAQQAGRNTQFYVQLFMVGMAAVITFSYIRDHGRMNTLFSVVIGLSAFPYLSFDDLSVSPTILTRDVRLRALGGDPHLIIQGDQPPVAGGFLVIVTPITSIDPGVEQIPIFKIKDVALENWGHSFVDRDLAKLFKKDDPPKNLVLRLYLDDADNPEREIKLPRAMAERWYAELKEAIRQD